MSGKGGAGGYDYQADLYAYIATHILCGHRLGWFDDFVDIPAAVGSETGGPGDDLRIETGVGVVIEVQSKHGLTRGEKFDETIRRLIRGLLRNPQLRCVLVVDSTASGPVKDEFRSDVLHLAGGRDDGLKEVTMAVLGLFTPAEGVTPETFQRFRVIVKDLAHGEDGRAVCTALLRQVVTNPEHAETAWELLGKDGHRQMTNAGRRDAVALARFLGSHVPLRPDTANLEVAAEAYRTWLIRSFGEFFVPGVGVSLSIDRAWIGLRIPREATDGTHNGQSISKLVESYHEWERLAERDFGRERREAEHLLAFDSRIAVVGGPGSGKSTLANRIAWRAALDGQRVLKVRLKTVAALLRQGRPFADALIVAAADASGLSIENALKVLASPDILLADGLDEADPSRADVSRAILSWAAGHPNCRVCVLTRPVGHEPGLLPGFQHVELLPLNREAIEAHSLVLFQACLGESEAAQRWQSFLRLINDKEQKHRAASLAARNPLLLGFMVRLTADGVAIGTTRAELYRQVIRIVHKSKVAERDCGPEEDEAVANRVVDILGWLITKRPDVPLEVAIREIGQDLRRQLCTPQLQADRESERVLRHWEARRLIERLTAGHREALVFVHPSLGEFAAARYVAEMTDEAFNAWVDEVRMVSRWRQVLLLTSGLGQTTRLVTRLLELDRPEDPTSTEAILAAAVLEEAATDDQELTKAVAERLTQRLTSSIPLIAVEAAVALMPLASFAAPLVGPVARDLIGHQNPSTHLAAVTLALTAGPEFITTEQVCSYLTDFKPTRGWSIKERPPLLDQLPTEAADLELVAVSAGLELLFAKVHPDAISIAEHIASDEKANGLIQRNVFEILEKRRLYDVVERIHAKWNLPRLDFHTSMARSRSQSHAACKAFLDAVMCATGIAQHARQSPSERPLLNLAAVFTAMRFPEVQPPSWDVIGLRENEDVVVELVKATIAALAIDSQLLGQEGVEAVNRLGENDSIFELLPTVSAKPDWSRCMTCDLDITLIGRGLLYPSFAIVCCSACVLSIRGWGPVTIPFVQTALTEGGEATLSIVSQMVGEVWGAEAVPVLLDRLQQPLTPGCQYLYKPLLELAKSEQTTAVKVALFAGLSHDDPAFAKAVAEMIQGSEVLNESDSARLEKAFDHWTRHGSWCERCRVVAPAGKCPTCIIVPPSPRAALAQKLMGFHVFSEEQLESLTRDGDHGVAGAARKALVTATVSDEAAFARLLEKCSSMELPIAVLDEVFTLPVESVRTFASRLATLATDPNEGVRLHLLRSLPSGWAGSTRARAIAETGLNDPHPVVRSQAARTLRLLRGEQ